MKLSAIKLKPEATSRVELSKPSTGVPKNQTVTPGGLKSFSGLMSLAVAKHMKHIIALFAILILIAATLAITQIRDERVKQESQRIKAEQQKAYASGLSAYTNGKFDAAIQRLEQAKKLDPADAKTHLNLAQSYEAKGQLDKASDEYRASLKSNPNQPEAHYNLAIIYKSQGNFTKAIQALETTIKLNKNFVTARIALGDLYVEKNDKGNARKQYETVIQMRPFGVDIGAIKKKAEVLK
ncbi:MAG: tetratricopeptide repeat protein [Candidatus Aquicultor sp.]